MTRTEAGDVDEKSMVAYTSRWMKQIFHHSTIRNGWNIKPASLNEDIVYSIESRANSISTSTYIRINRGNIPWISSDPLLLRNKRHFLSMMFIMTLLSIIPLVPIFVSILVSIVAMTVLMLPFMAWTLVSLSKDVSVLHLRDDMIPEINVILTGDVLDIC